MNVNLDKKCIQDKASFTISHLFPAEDGHVEGSVAEPAVEDLVATLEDDDVVAAVVGGAVPYLDRGPLLDPLLPRLVGHHALRRRLGRGAGVLII